MVKIHNLTLNSIHLFPESKRLAANTRTISNISYHGLVEQKEEQEKKRSVLDPDEVPSVPQVGKFISVYCKS